MKSDEYWRKREEAARKDRVTDEKEMQKQIDAINQRMIDECNLQIDAWLQRYADKDGISLAEAKKRVSKLDIEEYERYAKKLVARGAAMRQEGKKVSYGSFTDEENEQMRLYNLTMKVNRLEMLKSRLGLETTAGYAELRNYLGSKLTDAAMAEAERQAGILGESVSMNAKEAGSIVNASFKGATFSQRLWNNQQELKAALDRSLTSALIQGQSSAKAAQQIREHFSGDFKKAGKAAMRLATTELARVEIGAQQKSFEKMDFKQYTFLAVGPHPCDICQALDGKHFDVDKMVPGENAPPMHPWCHCSVSAYSDRSDYDEWLNSGAAKKGVTLEEFKRNREKHSPSRVLFDFSDSSLAKIFGKHVHFKTGGMDEKEYAKFASEKKLRHRVNNADFNDMLRSGIISTKIGPEKQERHIKNTFQFNKRFSKGERPGCFFEGTTLNDIYALIDGKLGSGYVEQLSDGSYQEFFDCEKEIGYYYSRKAGKYIKTKRVQVKYALGTNGIHIIPVKERDSE